MEVRPINSSNTATQASLHDAERFAIERAHLLHGQLQSAIEVAKKSKNPALSSIDFMGEDSPYIQRLREFYRENLALARMLDSSDLLLHAEGPAAAGEFPQLSAFNWLCQSAQKQLNRLTEAFLPRHSEHGASALDFRMTGTAPGSLYVGFALSALCQDQGQIGAFPDEDTKALHDIRQTIHALPIVPQFVGSESVSRDILEALPDPALRDAAMIAAYELSPTGRRGIHTLQISSPLAQSKQAHSPQQLGQPQRVVLADNLKRAPMMRQEKAGKFTGTLRGIDLDTRRITLRNISNDIPIIRASVNHADAAALKTALDKTISITGVYECGQNGMPRLMRADSFEFVQSELLLDVR